MLIADSIETTGWQLGPLASYVAGPFAELLSAVIGSRATEADFLCASHPRRHAILAALDHPRFSSTGSGPRLAELKKQLAHIEPIRLLESLYGCGLKGLMATFDRLGMERAPALGYYRSLIALLAEDGLGAKTLRHTAYPNFHEVQFYSALPDWARVPLATGIEQKDLDFFVWLAQALVRSGLIQERELTEILQRHGRGGCPLATFTRAGFEFDLPKPPWAGSDRLRPLKNTRHLVEVGDLFRNCLDFYVRKALVGACSYYVWTGAEPGVVELEFVNGLWWRVSEARGLRNISLSQETRATIEAELPLAALNSNLPNCSNFKRRNASVGMNGHLGVRFKLESSE